MTDSRLGPAKPLTPYVPPGKGPVEPERVEGNPMPLCEACGKPIEGPYRHVNGVKYHWQEDKPLCRGGWCAAMEKQLSSAPDYGPGYRYDSNNLGSTSALGVPMAEIRENVLPSNEKAISKVAHYGIDILLTIGTLDRCLSEMLLLAADGRTQEADRQTLKHHADDMEGVAKKVKELLGQTTKEVRVFVIMHATKPLLWLQSGHENRARHGLWGPASGSYEYNHRSNALQDMPPDGCLWYKVTKGLEIYYQRAEESL